MASRILIISTNREVAPQPVFPAGGAWVAQALSLARFQVRFLDLCFDRHPLKSIERAVAAFRPDGIGLSIRNLDNCDLFSSLSYLPEIRQWTERLKQLTDAPMLVGGAGVGIMPLQVLEYLDLPYAVAGDGEEAAVRFFSAGDPEAAADIPEVIRKGTTPHGSGAQLPAPITVMPQLHRWVETKRYLRYEPVLPIQGKRGCANDCLYCTYNAIEGKEWRIRDPAEVIQEMAVAMRTTGASEFEFVDSVFNEPEGYLEALLEQVVRSRLHVRLHLSSLSPRGLTAGQVRLMERSGVVSAVVTPESAADEMLGALRKGFTADHVHGAAALLAGSTISTLWCFLLGGPGEDGKTVDKTVRFINRWVDGKACAYITTGLRIYPGTGLHRLAVAEGVVPPEENLLMPRFYFSRRLTLQETFGMLRNGLDKPQRCIFPSHTRHGALPLFRRVAVSMKARTPFWRYSPALNRMVRGSGHRTVM